MQCHVIVGLNKGSPMAGTARLETEIETLMLASKKISAEKSLDASPV